MVLVIALISRGVAGACAWRVLAGAVLAAVGVICTCVGSTGSRAWPLLRSHCRWSPPRCSPARSMEDRCRRARGDHLPGHARHVDGDPAVEADRRDGPSARWHHDLRAAGVGEPALGGVSACRTIVRGMRAPVAIGVVVLVCQIALGGWTSSNYAALACGRARFPEMPRPVVATDGLPEAFVLWRASG